MTANKHEESREAPSLWRALDLLLEAHAVTLDREPEVANLAMVTALALGERLGLSDTVVHLMGQSAAAAKLALRARSRRHASGSR